MDFLCRVSYILGLGVEYWKLGIGFMGSGEWGMFIVEERDVQLSVRGAQKGGRKTALVVIGCYSHLVITRSGI